MSKDRMVPNSVSIYTSRELQQKSREPAHRDQMSKQGAQENVPYQSQAATPNKNVD